MPRSRDSWIIRLMGAESGATTATIRSSETMLPKPMLMSFIVPHSTFWTCSRIFSTSAFRATTISAMATSLHLDRWCWTPG